MGSQQPGFANGTNNWKTNQHTQWGGEFEHQWLVREIVSDKREIAKLNILCVAYMADCCCDIDKCSDIVCLDLIFAKCISIVFLGLFTELQIYT